MDREHEQFVMQQKEAIRQKESENKELKAKIENVRNVLRQFMENMKAEQ